MLTGEIRGQIDRIWDSFWSGGISNPLEVIEQITYLLFLKRLDELETAEELKANREKKPMEKRFFPEGKDSKKRSYQDASQKRVLYGLVTRVFAKCSNKIPASLRSSDEHGLDRAARTSGACWQCGIAQIENEGWLPRESNWRGYIWTATVAGRVN
jgi:HsdM N-terminal domain